MKKSPFAQTRRQSGLTLVELIVVLFILVLLASVAVVSTSGLADQARYEATKTSMANWEEAVLGPMGERLPDGSPWVRGFAADVGRLPKRVGAVDDGSGLQELWVKPASVLAFGIQTAVGDFEVRLPAGWRGPYLKLPIDTQVFRDGYAVPYQLLKADETAAADGEEVTILRSFGADEAAGGTGLNADVSTILHKSTVPAIGPKQLGDLTFLVHLPAPLAAGDRVILRVYGPVDGTLKTLREYASEDATDTGLSDIAIDDTNIVLTAAGAPATKFVIGPRAIRAYLMTTATNPALEDPLVTGTGLATGLGVTKVSPVTPVAVVEGGNPPLPVEIP